MQNHISNNNTVSHLKAFLSNFSPKFAIPIFVLFLATTELNAQDIEMQNNSDKSPTSGKLIDKEAQRERNAINATASLIGELDSLTDDEITRLLENIKENGFSQLIIHLGDQTRTIPTNRTDGKERLQAILKIHGPLTLQVVTPHGDDMEAYVTVNKTNKLENMHSELENMHSEIDNLASKLKKIDDELKKIEEKSGIIEVQVEEKVPEETPPEEAPTINSTDSLNNGEEVISILTYGSLMTEANYTIYQKTENREEVKEIVDKINKALTDGQLTVERYRELAIEYNECTGKKSDEESKIPQISISEEKKPEKIPMFENTDSLDLEKKLISPDTYDGFMREVFVNNANEYGNREKTKPIVDKVKVAFTDGQLTLELYRELVTEYDNCMRKGFWKESDE